MLEADVGTCREESFSYSMARDEQWSLVKASFAARSNRDSNGGHHELARPYRF